MAVIRVQKKQKAIKTNELTEMVVNYKSLQLHLFQYFPT
jgi:hypothetical protein